MAIIDFAEVVRRRLAERGQSQYRAAVNGGLPQDAIRSVLNGHVPRLNRVEQICRALGLSSTSVRRGMFRSRPMATNRPAR